MSNQSINIILISINYTMPDELSRCLKRLTSLASRPKIRITIRISLVWEIIVGDTKMKVTNIKAFVLAGMTALSVPVTAEAALTFGEWTVTTGGASTGVISGCPTGASGCTTLVQGEGFLQQQVDFAAVGATPAVSYIQTIITDPNANAATAGEVAALPYSDESYVQTTGSQNGIAGKQTITDANFNFNSSTELYTGWAAAEKPVNSSSLNITQSFSDKGTVGLFGDEFTSSFNLKVDLDAAGQQLGKSMTLGQIVEMGDGNTANLTDIQQFLIEQRTGTLQAEDNSATGFALAATSFDNNGNPINGTSGSSAIGITGGAATWVPGDDVMIVWLGQKVSADTAGNGGISVFGYESISVNPSATSEQFASTFSTASTGIGTQTAASAALPFNWDQTTFGVAAPTLPAPAVSTPPTITDSGACEAGTCP